MKYYTSPKRERHFMTQYTRANAPNGANTLLCYSKFTHSCRVSERREGKRERQVMPPLVLLIKFVLLLIIFQVSSFFDLLVANWPLSPEFWSPNIFSTRHGEFLETPQMASILQGEGGKDPGKASRQLTKTLIQMRPGALLSLLFCSV